MATYAPMTLIQIVREFCLRRGLPRPAAAAGSSDAGEAQYVGLMNEMLDEVTTRKAFKGITREQIFLTAASSDQGNIYTLTEDAGFQYIIPDTFWNRTAGTPIRFGVSPEEWQSLQVTGVASGPGYIARLRQAALWVLPIPPANETWAFEYKTKLAVVDGATTVSKQYFTRDDDTTPFPDHLCLAWLNFAWKREKGFEHAEAQRSFEGILAEYMAMDLQLGPAYLGKNPLPNFGVRVAEGSWPL